MHDCSVYFATIYSYQTHIIQRIAQIYFNKHSELWFRNKGIKMRYKAADPWYCGICLDRVEGGFRYKFKIEGYFLAATPISTRG